MSQCELRRTSADGLVALFATLSERAAVNSTHYIWEVPNRGAIDRCETAASTIKLALGWVPFDVIGYDHG